MDRRQWLGAVGAGTTGMLLLGGSADGADDHHHHDEDISTMARCAKTCGEAAAHCLEQLKKGGSDAEKHARALATAAACEEFCILSAKQSACGSPLASLAHEANSHACDRCAEACQGFDSQIMKDCVESCRKCAEVCRKMAQKSGSR